MVIIKGMEAYCKHDCFAILSLLIEKQVKWLFTCSHGCEFIYQQEMKRKGKL